MVPGEPTGSSLKTSEGLGAPQSHFNIFNCQTAMLAGAQGN